MAHSLAQANLGLTNPSPNETPQVIRTLKFYCPLTDFSRLSCFSTCAGFCLLGLKFRNCIVGFCFWVF